MAKPVLIFIRLGLRSAVGVESAGKPLLLSNDKEGDAEVSGPRTVLCASVCYYRPKTNTSHRMYMN